MISSVNLILKSSGLNLVVCIMKCGLDGHMKYLKAILVLILMFDYYHSMDFMKYQMRNIIFKYMYIKQCQSTLI